MGIKKKSIRDILVIRNMWKNIRLKRSFRFIFIPEIDFDFIACATNSIM